MQHKVDRWTGRSWEVVNGYCEYGAYSNYEMPHIKTGKGYQRIRAKRMPEKKRNNATRIWLILVV